MTSQTSRSNRAAWLTKSGAPLQVKLANFTHAGPGQIVIKAHAIAVNPIDWILQHLPFIFSHIKLPFILGHDVAGVVVEVGPQVTRFEVGDRVVGKAAGTDARSNNVAESGFQEYVVLREHLVSKIPVTMTFEAASVLPLGLSTAASGLYEKDQLALQPPSLARVAKNQTVIIWGASTSVGSNAIQLAYGSGYEVIATASPKNHEYVKSLGAYAVFDYRSKTVVQDITAALKGKQCAGAVAIGDGSAEACLSILSGVEGKKHVAQVSVPLTSSDITTSFGKVRGILAVLRFNLYLQLASRWNGVKVKAVDVNVIESETSRLIYQDFLPEALAQGGFVVAPSPVVVGNGLEKIQQALDMNRLGMSAGKAVVTLS